MELLDINVVNKTRFVSLHFDSKENIGYLYGFLQATALPTSQDRLKPAYLRPIIQIQ